MYKMIISHLFKSFDRKGGLLFMASKTFRLFRALPCFLLGVATIIDMGATMNIYNYDATPSQADANAIASDWEMVGADINVAINKHKLQVQ